jgi:hypothetical protein
MPRKSVASLSIVPRVPGRGRPEPPADLDALESRIWREVVDALPGHWLDTAGQLILRRLAAQAAVSERQEARLRQLRAQDEDDDEEAAILASQHGVMAKNVAYLLTQLRATPRAQLRSRAAGSRAQQAPETRPAPTKLAFLSRLEMNDHNPGSLGPLPL